MEPRLLVLDEPITGNLDPGGFMRIMEAMNLLRGQGTAMLISTSSPSLASLKGASVYYFVDGALIPHGRARETHSRAAEGFFRQIRQYTDRQQRETLEFYRTTLPGGER
jgi:ABC-type multidrug transport system ATPase subunit